MKRSVALCALLISGLLPGCGLPSEQALVKRFERDRHTLEELTKVIYAGVNYVDQGDVERVNAVEVRAYLEGQDVYKKLLAKAAVRGFRLRRQNEDEIAIFLSVQQTFFAEEVGFAYFPEPPEDPEISLVQNISTADHPPTSEYYLFLRHVEGRWYVYLENLW